MISLRVHFAPWGPLFLVLMLVMIRPFWRKEGVEEHYILSLTSAPKLICCHEQFWCL